MRVWTDELPQNGAFKLAELRSLRTCVKGGGGHIRWPANLAQNLRQSARVKSALSNSRTFRFSTCRSAGEPWNLCRYGGHGCSRCSTNSIGCDAGILQSGLVSRRTETVSCHILRRTCGVEEERSTLTCN